LDGTHFPLTVASAANVSFTGQHFRTQILSGGQTQSQCFADDVDLDPSGSLVVEFSFPEAEHHVSREHDVLFISANNALPTLRLKTNAKPLETNGTNNFVRSIAVLLSSLLVRTNDDTTNQLA
jgi:hypothetical protein